MLQLDAGIEEILRSAFAQAVPEWRSGSKPALLRARCRRLMTAGLNISAPLARKIARSPPATVPVKSSGRPRALRVALTAERGAVAEVVDQDGLAGRCVLATHELQLNVLGRYEAQVCTTGEDVLLRSAQEFAEAEKAVLRCRDRHPCHLVEFIRHVEVGQHCCENVDGDWVSEGGGVSSSSLS